MKPQCLREDFLLYCFNYTTPEGAVIQLHIMSVPLISTHTTLAQKPLTTAQHLMFIHYVNEVPLVSSDKARTTNWAF